MQQPFLHWVYVVSNSMIMKTYEDQTGLIFWYVDSNFLLFSRSTCKLTSEKQLELAGSIECQISSIFIINSY